MKKEDLIKYLDSINGNPEIMVESSMGLQKISCNRPSRVNSDSGSTSTPETVQVIAVWDFMEPEADFK